MPEGGELFSLKGSQLSESQAIFDLTHKRCPTVNSSDFIEEHTGQGLAQGRTVTWCLARAMGSLPRSCLGPFHMLLPRKRKTSRKWEETWSPDPVPRPCYQSLPAWRMNVAFVPSAASQGFQATTSSQEGTSGAARSGDRDDQTSQGPHPEREAVRWALAKRGRPVARPQGPSLTAALQPGARATVRPRAGSPWPVPPPVWGSSHRLCRSSWLSLGARRLRQLMNLRLVCRRSRWSKVPVFGGGPGAGGQDPPLKGARGAGRDAQRPWIGARMLAHTPEKLLGYGSSS